MKPTAPAANMCNSACVSEKRTMRTVLSSAGVPKFLGILWVPEVA